MKKTNKIVCLALGLLTFINVGFAKKSKSSNADKDMAQTWKMWKVEANGKEAEPLISRFILSMKKNHTFVITTEHEMTHRGTWNYSNKSLTLHDKVTNKDIVLPVKKFDHTHLVLEGYEGAGRTTFMTPTGHKDAVHLNHKEHLLAKKWKIYESTREENKGAMYVFYADKTFEYFLARHTVPVSKGKWTLADDASTVTLHIKKQEDVVLTVKEFHRHELTLQSPESKTINYMHDEYLVNKDEAEMQLGN